MFLIMTIIFIALGFVPTWDGIGDARGATIRTRISEWDSALVFNFWLFSCEPF